MKKGFLFLTVFFTGMAVMAVEMTASRLIAPYFGTSLFIWTNLIGIVLLALSLGYYLGGKLADRKGGAGSKIILYWLILLTGVFVSLIPLVMKPVLAFSFKVFASQDLSIFYPSFIAIFVLFTLPILALGMVSPLAARVGIEEVKTAGSVVGDLYAFSTMGSLVGTFLPVLVLVPFVGSQISFYLFGALLILLGILGLKQRYFLFLLLLPFLASLPFFKESLPKGVLFRGESPYQYIQVREMGQGGRGLFFNEGLGVQSIYIPKNYLTGFYWDAASLLPVLYPKGKRFLILGLAGGTSARSVNHFYPHLQLTGVEIDPLVVTLSKKYFGLEQVPIKIIEADGRVYLNNSKERFDFIMVDVFRDGVYIPFHLATQEFFVSVKAHLTKRGVFFMNVFSPEKNSALLKILKNTVASVFPYFYELRLAEGTTLFFASASPLAFEIPPEGKYPQSIYKMAKKAFPNMKKVKEDAEGIVSKDDRSLVEVLSGKVLFLEKKRQFSPGKK